MKRISVRDMSSTSHVSIVVAVRANGLPYGKPIIIVKGAAVTASWVNDTEDYLVINTQSGGMEGYAWEQCCRYWATLAEGGEIFVVDGYGSHEDLLANNAMLEKHCEVVTFPPHVTDVLQVSDVRVERRGRACEIARYVTRTCGRRHCPYALSRLKLTCDGYWSEGDCVSAQLTPTTHSANHFTSNHHFVAAS